MGIDLDRPFFLLIGLLEFRAVADLRLAPLPPPFFPIFFMVLLFIVIFAAHSNLIIYSKMAPDAATFSDSTARFIGIEIFRALGSDQQPAPCPS